MKKLFLLFIGSLSICSLWADGYEYKFRLTLKDKGETTYSIDRPLDFLSQKAIDRRIKQGYKIDETDLPIATEYIKAIEDAGGIVVAKSKWMKSVAVHCNDSMMVDTFKALPFVENALFVWRAKPKEANTVDTVPAYPAKQEILFGNYYGKGDKNIKLHNGQHLHEAGFKGNGIDIAVIDAGFNHLPKIELLDNLDIKGYKGFVYQNEDLFSNANQHGLNVLSCIGTNKPNQYVGTAPEASFWLLGSEDARSEFPIEEDYWAAAIEYADSVGVDVVNTSLGYANFDKPAKSYTHHDLNGRTAFISIVADKAVNKGIFVVGSAGNSGNSDWRKITMPGDAVNVLTVGAIQKDSTIAKFSSKGMTADLRVKPDVVTLGVNASVVNDKGLIRPSNGTSFSSPIMCGMVACLWQALPTLTNKELLDVIRISTDRHERFDEDFGFGIPDMKKALQIGKETAMKKDAKKVHQQKAVANNKVSTKKRTKRTN